jgi:hypothetical protein
MKDQVTTIEQWERLKKCGVPAEKASMCWVKDPNENDYNLAVHDECCYEMAGLEPIPAFTVADLQELLPMFIDAKGTFYLNISKCYEGWYVSYETESGAELISHRGTKLVDVLMAATEWVLSNGYMLNV